MAAEREDPPIIEKVVRYPVSALFFLGALSQLVHLNVVVTAADALIGYFIWPKQKQTA